MESTAPVVARPIVRRAEEQGHETRACGVIPHVRAPALEQQVEGGAQALPDLDALAPGSPEDIAGVETEELVEVTGAQPERILVAVEECVEVPIVMDK